MLNSRAPLIIVASSLVALPFALDLAGLPLRSSIDVVAFAVACMLDARYRPLSDRFARWQACGADAKKKPALHCGVCSAGARVVVLVVVCGSM